MGYQTGYDVVNINQRENKKYGEIDSSFENTLNNSAKDSIIINDHADLYI